ncbi:protein TESPA1 isoform X2 [Sceloporus undulatus]|uniref:protein TESPA1 isoform X2 n=1 Tax=Sceloporus undulatus TaxID=8520 RepID=UPI001C4CE760|nr:protein TESPA1 isoform X2 [Sceloporus undulatus]
MDQVTSWLGQSSWERRKAWAKQGYTWPAVEEEIPDAPQDTFDPQASFLEHGFLQGISSDKIESWLEECSSSVEPLAESIPALLACGSFSNRTSFEDDLTLGAEAMLLLDKDRTESRFPKGSEWPSHHINLDHSMASSGISASTNKTSSSISEVLDLCEADAETILCNLGFSQEEPQATSWIPARFFSVPSQAKGIDFQLFLRAQVQRIETEDPCLILASRFKQVQTLAATADAFFCLYSYVSKTPVQKISPAHFFWAFPEIPALWNAPSSPESLTPLQRLQRAVSRMCLYTSPRQSRLPGVSEMQIPVSRLERIVQEVMAKSRKDRLDEAHTVTPGDPFSHTKMESASSKSTMAESTLVASPCFCCEAQSREKTDLILPGLRQWFTSCTSGTSRDVPDHDGYQELFHYSHLSPPSVSFPDESSEDSDEESSE